MTRRSQVQILPRYCKRFANAALSYPAAAPLMRLLIFAAAISIASRWSSPTVKLGGW
jgi:hypothetical protein